ncbi:hypothetical protein OG948_55100 (plasmid) [Embleya sp. NBC_00888]|uniref:FtsX-like permease family protein n=1 Tax=Embleya sp. NBC_00888 TaxID=2975960 RepID=UPI002F90BE28|nr:hypothetical protein OG948_55100 [Embleya sp. NBC_00888]
MQPLQRVGAFAGALVRLIAGAGAVILGLIVTLTIRERRDELGVPLSLGERKWKLVAQQAAEIVAVVAVAVGLSSLFAQALTERVGNSLVSSEASAAQRKLDAWQPPAPGSTGLREGIDPDSQPVKGADPIDEITVRLHNGTLAAVAGLGLGIALPATAIPATSVLRLSPRSILSTGK